MKKERINESNRHYIAVSLTGGKSLASIAADLGKSASTISREVRNHLVVRRSGGRGAAFNECVKRFSCQITSLCKGCYDRKCRNCSSGCNGLCSEFSAEKCIRLRKPPYVCATGVTDGLPVHWKSIITMQSARRKSMRQYGRNPIRALP